MVLLTFLPNIVRQKKKIKTPYIEALNSAKAREKKKWQANHSQSAVPEYPLNALQPFLDLPDAFLLQKESELQALINDEPPKKHQCEYKLQGLSSFFDPEKFTCKFLFVYTYPNRTHRHAMMYVALPNASELVPVVKEVFENVKILSNKKTSTMCTLFKRRQKCQVWVNNSYDALKLRLDTSITTPTETQLKQHMKEFEKNW
jgi:hypothetical protein